MEKKRKKQREKSYPVALTIAASASGGSSGVQADLRTFNAFGVYGCSAITAIASHNPGKTDRIDTVAAECVASQLEAITSGINVAFAKSGTLFTAEIIDVTAAAVKNNNISLVCDPAFVSADGKAVMDKTAIQALMDKLLPIAAWITPNIMEAEILLDRKISTFNDQFEAAEELYDRFGSAVLLKGGHLTNNSGKLPPRATDVICRNGELWKISSFKVDVPAATAHGAGCTLSAALAATLALEIPWKEAICESKAFVMGSLVENIRIGDKFSAMYPPSNDYMSSIQLQEAGVK